MMLLSPLSAFAEDAELDPASDLQEYEENEILVSFREDISLEKAEEIAGGDITSITDEVSEDPSSVIQKGEVVSVDTGEISVEEKLEELASESSISFAQPNYYYSVDGGKAKQKKTKNKRKKNKKSKNKKLKRKKYKKKKKWSPRGWNFNYLNTKEAWDLIDKLDLPYTTKVVVATIDTGIELDHPDLQKNIDKENCVRTIEGEITPSVAVYRHGTRTASIIAADTGNGKGCDGIATGHRNNIISLFGVNVFVNHSRSAQYSASTRDIIAGLEYARTHGAKVINMSMGYLACNKDYEGSYHDDPALHEEIKKVASDDIVVCCSAGNNLTTAPYYPSDFEETISAIPADRYTNAWGNVKLRDSNFGPAKTVSAPGHAIRVATLGKRYAWSGHSSSAAAHTSAVCALIRFVDPSLTRSEVKDILIQSSHDLYLSGWDDMTGSGMINAYDAVRLAAMHAEKNGTLINSKGSKISSLQLHKAIKATTPSSRKKKMPAPKFISAKAKKKGVRLRFSRPSFAHVNKIVVYRSSAKKGHWKKVASLKGKRTSWTDKHVSHKRKYRYRLQAYGTTYDGRKALSRCSRTISVRAK